MTATTTTQDAETTPVVQDNQLEDIENRIRIRSYEPRDHAAVIDIFVPGLLLYSQLPGQERKVWDDYIAQSLKGDLADIEATYFATGGHYWVAVIKHEDGREEIVGMVALEPTSKHEGELRRMSVKAEYRRFGVGRLLVENLEAWAVDHGFTRVWLAVGYVLERAHRFYESLGFSIFEDRPLCTDPNFIEACFEKRLAPTTAE